MEKLYKQSLITINNGSYGTILSDNNDNVYKLTFLLENNLIVKNNIIECCMLKNKLYNNKSKNIMTAEVEIYNIENFLNKFIVDEKCSKIFKKYKYTNYDYIFLSKMKKYDINLQDYSKRNKFHDFNFIAKELLLGLNILHQNNFLHGDLKLANILYDHQNLVLIDFGGIKNTNSVFYTKTCTLTYRSPEELNHDVNNTFFKPSFKNDIWSLGIIFSELLFNKSFTLDLYNNIYNSIKFSDKNVDKENLIEKRFLEWFINNKEINIINYANEYNIKNIENKIINIINKMLSVDYEKRYNNLNEIYYDLFNKNIKDDIKDDYVLNYSYEINISADNLIKLNEIREREYTWLLDFYTNDEILLVLPLTFNIADRFYTYILNNNIPINDKSIKYDINKIIMICCNLLSMTFLYKELPDINDIYSYFFIKNIKLSYFNIIMQYYISKILFFLDFDIYRPYYIELNDTILNNSELFLKYKNMIYKILHKNIICGKQNIIPEDYTIKNI